MDRVNVIHLLPCLNDGGAENLVKDYAKFIDKTHFNFTIVVLQNYHSDDTAVASEIKSNNIKLLSIYPKCIDIRNSTNILLRLWRKVFGKLYVSRVLLKILKHEKADVLHIHMDMLQYLMPIRKQIRNIRMFYTCHSIARRWLGSDLPLEHEAAKVLIEENHLKIIALTESMKLDIDRMFPGANSIILYNGSDERRFITAKTKEEIRDQLGIPKDAFVIGNISRFVKSKNHELLLKIFIDVLKINQDAFLLMVGAGDKIIINSLKMFCEKNGVADRVMMLSKRNDVPDLMKAMDVFLFPTQFEGFSIVMIEAQQAGIRCVASTGCPEELFIMNNAIGLSVNAPLDNWVDAVLYPTFVQRNKDIHQLDIRVIVKNLECIYLKALQEK